MQPPMLYKQYFIDRDFERLELLRLVNQNGDIRAVLYPGSFVHITPSFIFPEVVYVDNDRKAINFFKHDSADEYIHARKEYPEEAVFRFHAQDYAKPIPESIEGFDFVISQYAGFISQSCKTYLKIGGWLLANNSHGDASMAFLDEDYQIAAVITGKPRKPRWVSEDLDAYFIPKKGIHPIRSDLEKTMCGVAYTKTAGNYLFKRTR